MARNTTNLVLKVWDNLMDRFSHLDLASNWDTIDGHNHSPGKGLPIPTSGIVDSAVTTAKLADLSTTTGKLADGAVTVPKAVLTSYHVTDIYNNRPPASAALNGVRFFATDKAMEWQCVGGAWVLINASAIETYSLPANPIDQQRCCLVLDAVSGIKVTLRYRNYQSDGVTVNPSAYKWEPEGAPPPLEGWTSNIWTGGVTNPSYVLLTPTITVPYAGDWDIEVFSEQMGVDPAAGGSTGWLSYKIGVAAPSDTDAVVVREADTPAKYQSLSFRRRKTALAASTVIQAAARVSNPGTFQLQGGTSVPYGLRAWPVRLG